MTRDEFESLRNGDMVYIPSNVKELWKNDTQFYLDWNAAGMDGLLNTTQEMSQLRGNRVRFKCGYSIPYCYLEIRNIKIKKHRVGCQI